MIRKFNSVAIAALAMLAAAGAQAQSSVSIYGTIDMSVGTFKDASTGTYAAEGTRKQGVESGKMQTSYIGFAGTEDLGGGLKAKFKLESFILADTGSTLPQAKTGGFWGRNSWVGLNGGFGSVVAGLNETPLFDATLAFNPFVASFGFSPSIRQYYGSYGHEAEDTAWSNSVTYYTPDGLGGFNGALQYSFKENGTGSGNVGGSVGWGAGPFALAAVFQQYKTGYSSGSQNTWQIDGSYDFGVFKLFGQYGEVKDTRAGSLTATPAGVPFKDKNWQIGGSIPLGAGALLASYGEQKHDLTAAGATETDKNDTFSLAYDYNLSKRTDVYVAYMYDKATAKGVTPARSFDNANSFGVGLKHRF